MAFPLPLSQRGTRFSYAMVAEIKINITRAGTSHQAPACTRTPARAVGIRTLPEAAGTLPLHTPVKVGEPVGNVIAHHHIGYYYIEWLHSSEVPV
ncbi:hypothetical protein L484_023786 [Morus notabilis]|uniref:Uncharacterized protein n=1 Tax=Morus notabilis TaxID=981085 RepID=W9QYN6_9ROSA|nr:hypothetical protein L484_023786 [Morus notabilis]